MLKVSIIIVTYNGASWIRKCLDSCKDYHTIVVDNNSTDSTINIIKEEYPEVYIREEKKNHGFGGANNIGISYALKNNADYVFLLNQDAYIEEDCIERLVNTHKNNREYGILSPIHLNGVGSQLDRLFSGYLSYDKSKYFYADALRNKMKDIYSVPFVNAAAWLLPVSTINKIGGFDPVFFHYGEDNNYCQRVVYHGYKIGVVPKAYIMHDREFRAINKNISIKDRLKKRNVFLKVKMADINVDFYSLYKDYFSKAKKNLVKSILRFKNVNYSYNDFLLIKSIKKEILMSREKNVIEGCHYIKKEN